MKSEIATVDAGSSAPASLPTSPPPPSPVTYATDPPLAKALWDYKGGLDVANNYLDLVSESYFRAVAGANALDRLARRYAKDWDRLPSSVQVRVDRLAADYIQEIQKDVPQYIRQLSDPLDEMLRQKNLAGSLPPPAGPAAGCGSWRDLAPQVVAGLERTQTSFRRLFVVDRTSVPLELSAESLLTEASQFRARLIQETIGVCLP